MTRARPLRSPGFFGSTLLEEHAKRDGTLSNGELLRVAEDAGFDVLLTTDNSIPYQQNLKERRIAIVVLRRNRWRMVQRLMPQIVAAVNAAKPGSYAVIEVPVR